MSNTKTPAAVRRDGLIVLLFVLASFSFAGERQRDEWVSLFDGKTLNGWSVHSGFAKYNVEDDAIVGTTVTDSPNTFLCTDREYGDFVLEFEVNLDPSLNSGVQIRSKIAEAEKAFVLERRDGEPQQRVIPPDRIFLSVLYRGDRNPRSQQLFQHALIHTFLAAASKSPAVDV